MARQRGSAGFGSGSGGGHGGHGGSNPLPLATDAVALASVRAILKDVTGETDRQRERVVAVTKALELQPQMAGKLAPVLRQMQQDLGAGIQRQIDLTVKQEAAQKKVNEAFKEAVSLQKAQQALGAYDPAKMAPKVASALEQEQDQRGKAYRARGGFSRAIEELRDSKAGKVAGAVAGGVGGAVSATAGGIGALTSGFGAAAGALTSGFGAAAGALQGFVAAANPMAMEKFQFVLTDISGVIGQSLTPVFDVLTDAGRLFGDVLASIIPSGDAFKDAIAPISEMLGTLREALAPVVSVVQDVLLVALKGLGVVLKIVLTPFEILAKLFTSLFGGGDALRSSHGAGTRNVSFTSATAHAQGIYAATLRAGSTAGKSTVYGGMLGKVISVLETIRQFVAGIADKLKVDLKKLNLPGAIQDLNIAKAQGKVLEAIRGDSVDKAARTGTFHGQAFQLNDAEKVQLDVLQRIKAIVGNSQEVNSSIVKVMERAARRSLPPPALSRPPTQPGSVDFRDTYPGDDNDRLHEQVDRSSRRGIDGHPGGGGR